MKVVRFITKRGVRYILNKGRVVTTSKTPVRIGITRVIQKGSCADPESFVIGGLS